MVFNGYLPAHAFEAKLHAATPGVESTLTFNENDFGGIRSGFQLTLRKSKPNLAINISNSILRQIDLIVCEFCLPGYYPAHVISCAHKARFAQAHSNTLPPPV
ncbi:hypothetical protein PUN28_010245 [Cardiocondyla obscurior]|uniref:Uncharacterized protein n=1 Tax=Cardiocondyla obscurior TaxID=286306 RepID=A0AAW2FPR4_9HYME